MAPDQLFLNENSENLFLCEPILNANLYLHRIHHASFESTFHETVPTQLEILSIFSCDERL